VPEIYYIDGYNLLHTSPEWSDLADEDLEAAREAVVEAVNRWTIARGGRACVFFDGQGRRAERIAPNRGRPGVEIVFTSSSLSADALIERAVYTAEHRHDVIVVTADRGIRDFCLGLGALSMTPDHFIAGLDGQLPSRPASRPGKAVGRVEDVLDEESSRRLREMRARFDAEE
jgi:predicted RNA-binding protein with PIN domain